MKNVTDFFKGFMWCFGFACIVFGLLSLFSVDLYEATSGKVVSLWPRMLLSTICVIGGVIVTSYAALHTIFRVPFRLNLKLIGWMLVGWLGVLLSFRHLALYNHNVEMDNHLVSVIAWVFIATFFAFTVHAFTRKEKNVYEEDEERTRFHHAK